MNEQKLGIPLESLAKLSREVITEGVVLLKNIDNALPIHKNERVSIFGRIQIDYYRSGMGSGGMVNVPYTVNILEGLRNKKNIRVNEELALIYEDWVKENPYDNCGGGWAVEPWNQKEMPLSKDQVESAANQSDKAIVVIGRTAGEDKDNDPGPGSYELTLDERNMIQSVCEYFDKVIIVLNVPGIIDMGWVNVPESSESLKSILYVWQGGMEGGNGIADILVGDATPSGKLTDTIAYSLDDYPSTMNYGDSLRNYYKEDIYVGYRYFETFSPDKVQYEFGYGLSYTKFKIDVGEVNTTLKDGKEYIEIQVDVTNVGEKYSGKEVVQVYYESPQGKLGKPIKQLATFEKTKLLNPGEIERLTLSFPINNMASYDDSGATGYTSCYVLEEGDYQIYVGNSIRCREKVSINGKGDYSIDQTIVVEELEEALAPILEYERIKPGERRADGIYEVQYEEVPRRTISMEKRINVNMPKTIKITGDKGIKLKDVAEGRATMDDFIAQLSVKELSTIVRGEGMCNTKVTPGTASAFGGLSDSLLEYGIPIGCTADGPSGIRMDSGLKATQIPIGTLLAATWNTELVEELYVLQGNELMNNEIDSLLGPGLNIHRNPLNGRNFEYFSEDPLVSGKFAAAVIRGLKKGGSNGTLKHFACNNQEQDRTLVDAVVSERALREIYLKGFEIAVKEGDSDSIMTAYNPINGHWTASNYDLNTTILRNEWGYKGIVMTDWWAKMNDVVSGGEGELTYRSYMVRSQNDLYMCVDNNGAEDNVNGDDIPEALEKGTLTIGELQRSAVNICSFLMKAPAYGRIQSVQDTIKRYKGLMGDSKDLIDKKDVQNISVNKRINIAFDQISRFHISKKGIYEIMIHALSPDNLQAQVSCNIKLNGTLLTTFQINGTLDSWVIKKLMNVEFSEGDYEIEFNLLKPNMKIDWIEIHTLCN